MGSPPSAGQRTPQPRPRRWCVPSPEARWSEGAAPPSRPCRTGTAAPELKHSDDPPHAPWFASATHGASPYPQPQPSGIPADPFSRSPYETFVDVPRILTVTHIFLLWGKYPPAKPGALGDVPLEAGDGSLTRRESGLAT